MRFRLTQSGIKGNGKPRRMDRSPADGTPAIPATSLVIPEAAPELGRSRIRQNH